MFKRLLTTSQKRSYFLFGPRQTGKSTYIKALLHKNDLYINLLPQRNFLNYTRNPNLFREELLAHQKLYGNRFTCFVDEIQKIPALLDEIHDLIETFGIRFALTGSSARKLKRGGANLLAGRADTYHLFPLTYPEYMENFDLEKVLQIGCLPYLWATTLTEKEQEEFLRAYTDLYLKEEIQAEGVVRNIGSFTRFLDVVAYNDGEIVNYSNISRECGVSVKTTQSYYQILEDTFLAHRLDPWTTSLRKRLVSHPRYYLFDMGVTNAICQNFGQLHSQIKGRRFEQFIILQIIALNSYYRYGYELFFWRTNNGLEIDLILMKSKKPVAAIEIKSNPVINPGDSYALTEFKKEYPKVVTYIICPVERSRILQDETIVIPWTDFLTKILPDFSN